MYEEAAMPYHPEDEGASAAQTGAEAARKQHEVELMAIEGVTGVAIGRTAIGDDAIVVYIMDASVAKRIPKKIGGYAVQTEVTGPINALPR